MKKKDILNRLNAQIEEMTPDMSRKLRKQQIVTETKASRVNSDKHNASDTTDNDRKRNTRQRKTGIFGFTKLRRWTAAFCVMAVVCICVTAVIVTSNSYNQYDTYINLSVNPSFDIVADSRGKVQKVIANNYQAQTLAQGGNIYESCKGKSISEATDIVTQQMIDAGYLYQGGLVEVSAISSRGQQATQDLLADISQTISNVTEQRQVAVTVNDSVLSEEQLADKAQQTDSEAQSANTTEQYIKILCGKVDYLEQLRQSAIQLLDEEVEQKINSLYRMQLLEKFLIDVEERQNIIVQMQQLTEDIQADATLQQLYEQHSLLYTETNGWWLRALNDRELMPQSAQPLLNRFESLVDRAQIYGFMYLVDSKVPNVGTVTWQAYDIMYSTIDVQLIRDCVDQLKDAIADISQMAVSVIDSFTSAIVDSLGLLAEECNTVLQSAQGVNDIEQYINSIVDGMQQEYDRLTNNHTV